MDGRLFFAASLWVSFALMSRSVISAPPPELQRAWRDDAALYDVQFVDSQHGWAVGEHGTLWRTTDGGREWSLVDTGSTATFRSVCLLTDEVGWIAGWQTRGSPDMAEGTLLATKDGGRSWQPIDVTKLSPLKSIRFFGLEEGVLIGEPTATNPTGVWNTTDGGQTWQPLAGRASRGWLCAAMVAPEMGLLAGRDGGVALLAGPQLLPAKMPPLRGRSVRGVAFSADAPSWLVGDGGLVLRSTTDGVTWEPADGLPDEIRQVNEFRTVAAQGHNVWITGNPGGVIWFSPDGGRKWSRQMTGSPLPLNKVHFVSPTHGCAVGELGVIHITNDRGVTWQTVHGQDRHAALLSVHSRLKNDAPEMTVKISGEQGYRSAAWFAIRPEETEGPLSLAERLQEAMAQSGGSAATAAWQLPLDIPGLDLDAKKLMENWQNRTENKLPQVLLGQLVRQIRVWRPHVVIIDQPTPEDAAGQFIHDATLKAIEYAGDSTRFLGQHDLGGVEPWTVDRVYLQLLPGNTGEIYIDAYDVLPRWKSAARVAAADSRTLLGVEGPAAGRVAYRSIDLTGKPQLQSVGTDFFAGSGLAAGSEVRRQLIPVSPDDRGLELVIKAAQRQRNMSAVAAQTLDDPRMAGQMLAQLKDVTAGMTAAQGATTLWELAGEYRWRGQLDLTESIYVELMGRFPDEPISADAARWLLAYLVSDEVAWQRVRQMRQDEASKSKSLKPLKGEPIRQTSYETVVVKAPALKEKERWQRAQHLARQLEERWPKLAASSEVQFPLAAFNRASGYSQQADTIYRLRMTDSEQTGPQTWDDVIRREVWLSQRENDFPEGMARCFVTPTKPILDGILSDECWQSAEEWRLEARTPVTMPAANQPLVLLSRDAEYLYIAASVPRIDGQSSDRPQTEGRTHDADLRRHDRLTIRLDTDRDYATWYEFQVDQRGWTSETCWEDVGWNPTYHVAVDGDETHWRVEMAIPWSILVAKSPAMGSAWGLVLERTAPGAGRHCWTRPLTTQSPGASLGMLRFE